MKMSILCIGKKTWQMQTQMLISWVLVPVGIAQHVTCHIYIIAQYQSTAGLCRITSFSRSDCRDLVSLEWIFLLKKAQSTFSMFKTVNLGQAASGCSYPAPPTSTATGTCPSSLTKLQTQSPAQGTGSCAFSLLRKFLLSSITALWNTSCL